MEFVNVFGVYIASVNLKSLDIKKALKYVQTEVDTKKSGNDNNGSLSKNQRILDCDFFSDVKEEIESYCKEYAVAHGHVVEGVKICNSWGNLLKIGEPIHAHYHVNSYISGSFYLTEGSPIWFHNTIDNLFTFLPAIKFDPNNIKTWQTMFFNPVPGSMFLFPSMLTHHVDNNSNSYRYSIAFNTLPCGNFGLETSNYNIQKIV
jgi:uncharacterized protein (TIGR02466 family)